jgi:hypothetical protein
MQVDAALALQVTREQMVEVTGNDLERVRGFLIASNGSTRRYFQRPPAAALVPGFWESPSLHCALRRRDLEDMLLCWWSDRPFEVRDIGSGRIVSVPLEYETGPADLQRTMFGRVVPLRPDPDDNDWSWAEQPGPWVPDDRGRPVRLGQPATLGYGTWNDVRYLQCWSRGDPGWGRVMVTEARRDWFPEDLIEIWGRLSQRRSPVPE